MSPIVITYLLYLTLSIALTIWVGRTLHSNGRIFLVDVFKGNEELADSINHLLLVGFYLLNLGWVCLMLKIGEEVPDTRVMIEALAQKMGLVLLVLGGLHMFNVATFNKMRTAREKSREQEQRMEIWRNQSMAPASPAANVPNGTVPYTPIPWQS